MPKVILHPRPGYAKKEVSERELPENFDHFEIILQAVDKNGTPIKNISLYRYKEGKWLADMLDVIED